MDPAAQDRAREALTAHFPDATRNRSFDFLHGDYRFSDLVDWERAMIDVLAHDHVNGMGVSQRRNRIRLAVTEPAQQRAEVRKTLEEHSVPSGAVVIEAGGEFHPSLRDQHRLLYGGLQIQYADNVFSSAGTCTLGYAAEVRGMIGIITASHCSAEWSSKDDTDYFQPNRTLIAPAVNQVASEAVDPPWGYSGHSWCPSGHDCRFSDANFSEATVDIAIGDIARTCCYSRNEATTNWNGTDTFDITGNREPIVGDMVDKVGRSTGWTWGYVVEDCFHHDLGDIVIMCQHLADYGEAGGDSGAPVFDWINWSNETNGGTYDVAYAGLHSGFTHLAGEKYSVYTSQYDLRNELDGGRDFHLCDPRSPYYWSGC